MIRLLLIDDEPAILDLVMAQLSMTGRHYELVAISELSALDSAIADLGAVDILMVDVEMPIKHGYEVSRELRSQFPRMLTIYFSGYPLHEVQENVKDGLFLAKPFTVDAFAEILERAEAELRPAVSRVSPEPQAATPVPPDEGFSGLLTRMRLFDVVQMLLLGHVRGRLMLWYQGNPAWIQIESGKITNAGCGDLQGEEAVKEIFTWKKGDFSFLHDFKQDGDGQIEKQWEELWLNALIEQDEGNVGMKGSFVQAD